MYTENHLVFTVTSKGMYKT